MHSRTYSGTTSQKANEAPEDTGSADKVAEDKLDAELHRHRTPGPTDRLS